MKLPIPVVKVVDGTIDPESWIIFEGWAICNETIWQSGNHLSRRGHVSHQESVKLIAYMLTVELEETRLKYRRHLAEFGPSKIAP